MVIEDDPSVDLERLVGLAILQRFNDDVAASRFCENGQPADNRCRDKMGDARFVNPITTAHAGASVAEA